MTSDQLARYAQLCDQHEELQSDCDRAAEDLDRERGTIREADAQAESARCASAMSAWLDSEEGLEWADLARQFHADYL